MLKLEEALEQMPLFAVVRGCPAEHLGGVVEASLAAGFTVIEVTLDSPDAIDGIRRLARSHPDASIGAGTALSVSGAEAAVEAGAGFVVSPVLDPEVVATVLESGVPVIPGAATPTEVNTALDAGASMVKIFPAAELGGPAFVRAVSSVLSSAVLVPTGGIDASTAGAHLDAGARAVGVGSAVFARSLMNAGAFDDIAAKAQELVEAVS